MSAAEPPATGRRRRPTPLPPSGRRRHRATLPIVAVRRRRRHAEAPTGFQVTLANFTGPFDLLLQLIGKHKLEITELALRKVTDEFIAYIRAMGDDWDLDEVSEFLVVAATLLDLKAARLLPPADGRGRGGPGPARGARPALRPAAAVQGVQGGGRASSPSSTPSGARRYPAGGHAGAAVRRGAARPGARHRPGTAGRSSRSRR